MPYRLTWEPKGVYREYFGNVTIEQRMASFNEILSDARFDDLRYTITDYLAVREYEITRDATAEIGAMHIGALRMNPRIRIAAVAVRRDILDAIEDLRSQNFFIQPYRVFSDLAAARLWAMSPSAPDEPR